MEAKLIGKSLATEDDHPHIPDEVIFENIMTRVTVSTLMRCSSICKHWYKSILDDPHFSTAYLAHQSSKKDFPFVLYMLNVPKDKDSSSKYPNRNYIFRLDEDDFIRRRNRRQVVDHGIGALRFHEKFLLRSEPIRIELVGNCNGFVCLYRYSHSILILNPSRRKDLLTIFIPSIISGRYIVCCYGFGFDSLNHEYKVVLIVCTIATAVKKSELKCLVFILGTNSWRETSTTIPLPITTTNSFYKSAIFCGGALFWRTKSFSSDNDVLLLSFNLHDYEFQVIRLPAECASSSLLEQEHQIIDPLLEFKGSPCVARLEKKKLGGESCSTSTTSDDQNTSYCYKVHLHILKEYSKVGRPNEQVWIKETFDVAPLSLLPTLLSPAAPCFVRDGSATTNRAPPNRIMASSDGRVFLYCFCGQIVQTYDLQTKRLKIANCNMYASIFFKKKHSKVYDQIDYQLNGGHIENFMSMLAFIPKGGGAPPRLDLDEFSSIMNDKQRKLHVVGYLSVGHQKSADLYLI